MGYGEVEYDVEELASRCDDLRTEEAEKDHFRSHGNEQEHEISDIQNSRVSYQHAD